MSDLDSIEQLTLAGVAFRCAQETEAFFQHQGYDPRYCHELFRRAILARDDNAYEFCYAQYRPLVTGWVHRHPAFPGTGEEADYFVNRAFEKLWTAMTPRKFERFADLKSVLRYLQMCVHSAIIDHVRALQRYAEREVGEEEGVQQADPAPAVEAQALAAAERDAFWRQINGRLNNDRERLVVYASYTLGLKPREVCAQFGETFADVKEVYRTKQNILDRLRRDSELKRVLGEYA